MKANLDKFEKLVTPGNSRLKEILEWEEANKGWLKKSAYVAVRVLTVLRQKGLTQKELAERMGVSPQYISKLLKGQENLSLETLCKLEQVLEIELLPITFAKPATGAEAEGAPSVIPMYPTNDEAPMVAREPSGEND